MLFRITCIVFIFTVLSGCTTIKYYTQAVYGQLELLAKRKQVKELLNTKDLDKDLRQKLLLSQDILTFAEDRLRLPVGKSYNTYVDLKRQYVVWNIFATPELSMTPKQWCYPIVGCTSYRGFFNKQGLLKLERQLSSEGYDVYIGGVKAYSTLGWFNDPLLNTFIDYDNIQLARLLFHELAHKKLYVPGDTDFNESFATVVELEGVRQWLAGQQQAFDIAESPVTEKVVELILDARSELADVYDQSISDDEKRKHKQRVILSLREKLSTLNSRYG